MTNDKQWSIRYRPNQLDKVIVGNPDILTLAKSAVKKAQCVLIKGESGTGKTTIGFALSHEINGPNYKRSTIYRDASNQGIDSIRELQAQIKFSSPGKKWVVILDECHGYSGAAQKALLTLVETPPNDNVLFVLCTDQTFALPSQMRNRCRRLEIVKPTYDDAKAYLYSILKAEKIKAEKTECFKLIKKALEDTDFCLRDTLQTLEDFYDLIQAGKSIKTVLGLAKGESGERKVTNVESLAGSLLLAVTQASEDLNKALKFILVSLADSDPIMVLQRMQGILYYGYVMKNGGKFNWQAKSYDAIFKKKPSSATVAMFAYELGRLADLTRTHTGDKAIFAATALAQIAMRQAKADEREARVKN